MKRESKTDQSTDTCVLAFRQSALVSANKTHNRLSLCPKWNKLEKRKNRRCSPATLCITIDRSYRIAAKNEERKNGMLFRWPHASRKMSASHQIQMPRMSIEHDLCPGQHLWLAFLSKAFNMCRGSQRHGAIVRARCNNEENRHQSKQLNQMWYWIFVVGGVTQKESRIDFDLTSLKSVKHFKW